MRYHVLASDYDGTLAHDGGINEPTLAALERLRATGRKLILVTGRELDELLTVCPRIDLFDRVVAENGAVVFHPSNHETRLLGDRPPDAFVGELRRRGVSRVSVGHSIVATWHPYENIVLEVIRDLGLELQVIFNKDAVMILPAGVNKATGLTAVLTELGLSAHEVVGVGDAENDHAFLSMCACAVAVDNALPSLKEHADWVTPGERGAGVTQLIDRLIADDLASLEPRMGRHHLLLGTRADDAEARLPPYGHNVLIAGPSGSGKSTVATALIERLGDQHYQFCIIDPEGDYEGLENALCLGDGDRPPVADEVLRLLDDPTRNVVVNLIGMPLADRPPFFLGLLPRLIDMRVQKGRPHWLILDEAHHLLPASWQPGREGFPRELKSTVFLTVHPDQLTPAALKAIDFVIAVGASTDETLRQFCSAVHSAPPTIPSATIDEGVLLWPRADNAGPEWVRITPSRVQRRRHVRKYAEGELPPDRSFYFRGPENKLNLRAQNLFLFMQLADGVDDETWLFHLRQGDYSTWFRERIKDEGMAGEAAEVEAAVRDAAESRERIKEIIGKHYTLPAAAPLPIPGTDAEAKSK